MHTAKIKQTANLMLGIGLGLFGGAMLWAHAAPEQKAPEVLRA